MSEHYVIRCVGLTGTVAHNPSYVPSNAYLHFYDPNAMGGHGTAHWTRDIREAIPFASVADAMKFWQTQPASRPLREDGKPNRPLTAFTIEIEKVETQ